MHETMLRWFNAYDEEGIHLVVRPRFKRRWGPTFLGPRSRGVVFKPEGVQLSDGLYIFKNLRLESWVGPTEARGGPELLEELCRRDLFSPDLLMTALRAGHGQFAWPP